MRHYSRGIPRLVNILSNKAMLAAYGKGLSSIGVKQVYLAALDTEDAHTHFSFLKKRPFLLLLLLLVALGSYVWTFMVSVI
jgi:MSHA biogenesis protein MshM